MSRWRRIFAPDEPAPVVPPVDELVVIQEHLDTVIRHIRSASGRIPTAAVVRARDVCDEVAKLVDDLARRRSRGVSIDALVVVTLEATVNDYLPTSLESFLAVTDPAAHRDDAALRKAEDQFSQQLDLLLSGVQELSDSVKNGGANPLDVQGRFLEAKFGKDDLRL